MKTIILILVIFVSLSVNCQTLRLNNSTVTIDASGDMTVNGLVKPDSSIHLWVYFGDSTISYSYTTDWQHFTNAYYDMYIKTGQAELDGFAMSNDTIIVGNNTASNFDAHFALSADNGETISIRFYNVTKGVGLPTSQPYTGRGAPNFDSVNTHSYYHADVGDRIVIQIKADGNGTAVLKNGWIEIQTKYFE